MIETVAKLAPDLLEALVPVAVILLPVLTKGWIDARAAKRLGDALARIFKETPASGSAPGTEGLDRRIADETAMTRDEAREKVETLRRGVEEVRSGVAIEAKVPFAPGVTVAYDGDRIRVDAGGAVSHVVDRLGRSLNKKLFKKSS